MNTGILERPARTATEQVFASLYDQIVGLELLPGTKISEAEIAGAMEVSRQPVRDAFYRLSRMGLLEIRPQRGTVVSHIQPGAVHQARYVRTALEVETVRLAASALSGAARRGLEAILIEQRDAADADERVRFHQLDDAMHAAIFEAAGKGFAWSLVLENKAHMDRVRYISLEFGAPTALEDHAALLEALVTGDPDMAEERMRAHLGRIEAILSRARTERPELFRAG